MKINIVFRKFNQWLLAASFALILFSSTIIAQEAPQAEGARWTLQGRIGIRGRRTARRLPSGHRTYR